MAHGEQREPAGAEDEADARRLGQQRAERDGCRGAERRQRQR
jgi:hypothetical protein